MHSTRKRRGASADADLFVTDHPFVRWYASYWKANGARYAGRPAPAPGSLAGDIFMDGVASRRFSIAQDSDNVPVLGVAEDDADGFMGVPWSGAGFIRRVNRSDWVAMSCPDARIDGGGAPAPVAIRLWLPATTGLLDGWIGATPQPTTLRVVEIAIRKGKPEAKGGAPLAVLPLSFRGSWDEDAKAA